MKSKQFVLGGDAREFKDYWKESGRKVHGGEHAKGKRKTARPFASKKPIHIVMRSERPKGTWSYVRPHIHGKLVELIQSHAQKSDVKLYPLSVNSNHLHFVVRAKTRKGLQNFLRSVTGHIARFITGAKRGGAKGKFWAELTFTRIIEWGQDFDTAAKYVVKNISEAVGFAEYEPRVGRVVRRNDSSA